MRNIDTLEKALALIFEYENCLVWHTNCKNCANLLDVSYRQTVQIEKIRVLHRTSDGVCSHCNVDAPCDTILALELE